MSSNVPATTGDETPDLFSDARLQLIRDNTAAGAPEHIFRAMIDIARVRGLDPLAKQISVIQFKDKWQVMTTIDGYRAIAESTGTYAGSDEAVFGPALEALRNGKRPPEWASVTVWKFAHGQRVPFTARVYWDEYYGGNFTWDKMPRTMLAKVAESHALRKGFPKVLSGLYTNEEMEQAGPVIDHDTGEIVDAPVRDQIAPGRTQVTAEALVDDPDEPQRLLAALHAAAAKYDIDHDALHAYFAVRGYDSLKDAPFDRVRELTAWLNKGSPRRSKDREKVQDTFRAAVMAYDGPLVPADGGFDTGDDPGSMDPDDYAQVVAAIEAEAAPANADRWTS